MDPREVYRLMRIIIARGHEPVIDPRARNELKAGGASTDLLSMFPVSKASGMDSVCCCVVFVPGEKLTLPDNKTGDCAWGCGRKVEFRPWVTLPTVCLYCMAERPVENN